jgi:hypothetical protein
VKNVYNILTWKPQGAGPYGTLSCTWENKNEADLRVIGCDGMDWIQLVQ